MGLTKDEIRAKQKVKDAEAALEAAVVEEAKVRAWQRCFQQPECPFCGHHRDDHDVHVSLPHLFIPRRGRKTGVAFLHKEFFGKTQTVAQVGCRTCGADYAMSYTMCYQRPDGNGEVVNRHGISEEELQIAVEQYTQGHRGPTWSEGSNIPVSEATQNLVAEALLRE